MMKVTDLKRDVFVSHKTPIFQLGIKEYAIDGQPRNTIAVCTTRVNKKILIDRIFDRNN